MSELENTNVERNIDHKHFNESNGTGVPVGSDDGISAEILRRRDIAGHDRTLSQLDSAGGVVHVLYLKEVSDSLPTSVSDGVAAFANAPSDFSEKYVNLSCKIRICR